MLRNNSNSPGNPCSEYLRKRKEGIFFKKNHCILMRVFITNVLVCPRTAIQFSSVRPAVNTALQAPARTVV